MKGAVSRRSGNWNLNQLIKLLRNGFANKKFIFSNKWTTAENKR